MKRSEQVVTTNQLSNSFKKGLEEERMNQSNREHIQFDDFDSIERHQGDIVKNLFHPRYQSGSDDNDEHSHAKNNTSTNADTGAIISTPPLFTYDHQHHSEEQQSDTDNNQDNADDNADDIVVANATVNVNATDVDADAAIDTNAVNAQQQQQPHITESNESLSSTIAVHMDSITRSKESTTSDQIMKANHLDLETMGLITPRKNLKSPPFVKRKVPDAIETDMNVEKGTHLFQNSQTCSPIPGPRPDPRPDSNPISFERKTRREYAYTDPSSSEEEERETSSLVSEYGSEVGAVNLRLEDVHAMEALAEGGSSDEDNDDSDDNDKFNGKDGSIVPAKEEQDDSLRHYKRDRSVKENDHGISYESLKDRRNNSSDGMQGNSYSHGHGHYHDEDDDNLSQEGDGSVDSVDLSSHYSPIPVASQYEGEDTPRSSDVLPKYATHLPVSLHTPNTPASPSPMMHQQKEDNQPTTPIGAVSAVLRRFGNGVSNMTRCTKTPPQLSPNRYTFVEDLAQQNKNVDDDDNAWLSPRFGNAKHHVPQKSIQLPMFRSAPAGRRRGNSASKAAVKGITSCLSFDPESGRRPYRNMRITDSPPSSPLPSCRKTRSWGSPGSAGSEILGGSVKELMDTSRGVKGLHNSGHRIGQELGQERLLAPNRDGAAGISPRGHIRFLDDPMYSPKASANARHLVLLQSPQVSDRF